MDATGKPQYAALWFCVAPAEHEPCLWTMLNPGIFKTDEKSSCVVTELPEEEYSDR